MAGKQGQAMRHLVALALLTTLPAAAHDWPPEAPPGLPPFQRAPIYQWTLPPFHHPGEQHELRRDWEGERDWWARHREPPPPRREMYCGQLGRGERCWIERRW